MHLIRSYDGKFIVNLSSVVVLFHILAVNCLFKTYRTPTQTQNDFYFGCLLSIKLKIYFLIPLLFLWQSILLNNSFVFLVSHFEFYHKWFLGGMANVRSWIDRQSKIIICNNQCVASNELKNKFLFCHFIVFISFVLFEFYFYSHGAATDAWCIVLTFSFIVKRMSHFVTVHNNFVFGVSSPERTHTNVFQRLYFHHIQCIASHHRFHCVTLYCLR